jgi:antirestriction protein ArdC
MKTDIYRKITDIILDQLEQGVRPWQKPWDAAHMEGRIARPLRFNGIPYNGINVLILWIEALDSGYTSPYWMTYRQAVLLNAHVRKGDRGISIVYSDKIIRAEKDQATGEETTAAIPFIKAYCVYNAEQIEGLPAQCYAKLAPRLDTISRIDHVETFFKNLKVDIHHNGAYAIYDVKYDHIRLPPFESFRDADAYAPPSRMNAHIGRGTPRGLIVPSLSALATKLTRWKNLSPNLEQPSSAPTSISLPNRVRTMPRISGNGSKCSRMATAIFAASSQAQRAADYLNGLQAPHAASDS